MAALKMLRSIFSFSLNNKGETINAQETEEEKTAREKKEAIDTAAAASQVSEQKPDWESEDNPYKKRYGDSQSQVQPLVKTLQDFADYDQATKTWKPKEPAKPEIDPNAENPFEGYDADFVKSIEGHTAKQIDIAIKKFKEESISTQKYTSSTLESRDRAIQEFGSEYDFSKDGKMNPESPLYKMADEILTKKYVELNPDGTFHKYSNVDAEYLATAEAFALLSKKSKGDPVNKEKLNAIQGKGSGSAVVKKKLSYEEYRALSTEDQDAYDLSEKGG